MSFVSPIFRRVKGAGLFIITHLTEVLIFAIIYWILEKSEPGKNFNGIDACNTKDKWCNSFIKFFYYSLCIQSTIGANDITPKSEKARIINIIQILLVFVGIALTSLF